jgi:glutaredoxin
MRIVLFGVTTCPYCKMMREYLDDKGLVYDEKLIDQDEEALRELREISGGIIGSPYLLVEKDGREYKLVGFDRDQLNEVFDD